MERKLFQLATGEAQDGADETGWLGPMRQYPKSGSGPRPNRARLKQDLAEAEQCIAEGEAYVELQQAIIARLKRQGDDTKKARFILRTLQDTLALHIEQRDQLKRQLARPEPRAKKAQESH